MLTLIHGSSGPTAGAPANHVAPALRVVRCTPRPVFGQRRRNPLRTDRAWDRLASWADGASTGALTTVAEGGAIPARLRTTRAALTSNTVRDCAAMELQRRVSRGSSA